MEYEELEKAVEYIEQRHNTKGLVRNILNHVESNGYVEVQDVRVLCMHGIDLWKYIVVAIGVPIFQIATVKMMKKEVPPYSLYEAICSYYKFLKENERISLG